MNRLRKVADLDELWSGELASRTLDGRRLLLVRIGGEVRAYEDRCPHLGLPLSRGMLDGTTLTCAGHHWQFDVRSGRGINPAGACMTPVRTRVENQAVLVDIGTLDDAAA